MSRLFMTAAIAFAFAEGGTLATDYTRERTMRVEIERTIEMATTEFSMERDGEPVEGRGGRGGGATATKQHIVHVDDVLEHEDGAPKRVRRAFKSVGGSTTFEAGENSGSTDLESPFEDLTLELSVDEDGDVAAEVVEGSEPDGEGALEGHRLTLALDAFLPDGEVGEGGSWELESDAVLAALGLDLERALFPRPQREEDGGGERGGRGRGRFGGGGSTSFLGQVEWEGKATLEAATEEYEGVECHVIAIELESSGDTPEPEGGGFGGGDDSEPPEIDSTYEIELEGRLLFSQKAGRPVRLEVEGTLSTEREMEMSRGGGTMVIYTKREGEFSQTVTVTEDSKE